MTSRPLALALALGLGPSLGACRCERPAPAAAPKTPVPGARAVAPKVSEDPFATPLAAAHAAAVAGDLEGARGALEGVLREHPRTPRIEAALASVYNRIALAHRENERLDDAAAAAARALELSPEDETLRQNRAALLYLLAGRSQNENARRKLYEDALEVDPGHIPTLLAAAEHAWEQNRLEEARSLYERAVVLRPDDQGLHRRLERVARQAEVEGAFDSVRHTHFEARFEGYADERFAWAVLEELERAWLSVNETLGVFPDERFSVVLYAREPYRRATGLPDWSGGAFDGKIRVLQGDAHGDARVRDLLWHEYVHALLAVGVKGRLPSWFHEGLAQALEPGRAAQLAPRLADVPELFTLEQLEAPFARIADPHAARVAYAQALSLVERLLAQGGAYGVRRLLSHIHDGEPFAEAMERVYLLDPAGLERDWLASLGR